MKTMYIVKHKGKTYKFDTKQSRDTFLDCIKFNETYGGN